MAARTTNGPGARRIRTLAMAVLGGVVALAIAGCTGGLTDHFTQTGAPEQQPGSATAFTVSDAAGLSYRFSASVLPTSSYDARSNTVIPPPGDADTGADTGTDTGPQTGFSFASCTAPGASDLVVPFTIDVQNLSPSALPAGSLTGSVDTTYGFAPDGWTNYTSQLSLSDSAGCSTASVKTDTLPIGTAVPTIPPNGRYSHTWLFVVRDGLTLADDRRAVFLHSTAFSIDATSLATGPSAELTLLDRDRTRIRYGFGCSATVFPLQLDGVQNSWASPDYAGCADTVTVVKQLAG